MEVLELLSNQGIFCDTHVGSGGKEDGGTFALHAHFVTSSVFCIKPNFLLLENADFYL